MVAGLVVWGCGGAGASMPSVDAGRAASGITVINPADRCGVKMPDAATMAAIERYVQDKTANSVTPLATVTIPVYVHVINKGTGIGNGNITSTQIAAQIKVLNDSYAGLTGGAV
ncbi:MAG: hypothetical protein QOJ65_42, partial [Fimbriimonadaceae bacterium]|nr:hypothetical protein [Fimbriimonadaceae bacterium]